MAGNISMPGSRSGKKFPCMVVAISMFRKTFQLYGKLWVLHCFISVVSLNTYLSTTFRKLPLRITCTAFLGMVAWGGFLQSSTWQYVEGTRSSCSFLVDKVGHSDVRAIKVNEVEVWSTTSLTGRKSWVQGQLDVLLALYLGMSR
ncbi:uncharacterized protein LOC131328806 isoform X2 [Rhododendron vialii]|uniref:uncharacterized protein LOC131328806 isoform X2 n=1 Tax=Rhododendron vialii TaxID=182163 RepID=UPI00265F8BAF|nr:uncharacterized protein LOC131328806 isoform X2 [Rhododendron vialii]